jgi:FkbM family methyltransferase
VPEVQKDLIYDIGMHQGEDTDFYLAKGFRVVAIDAMSEYCDAAAARFAGQLERRDLTIINGAISDSPGPVTFYVSPKSDWGTIRPAFAERNTRLGYPPVEAIEVDSVSLSDVLRTHGVPYFMKIDIEGADAVCLAALHRAAERPRYLSLESSKTSWRELVAEFDALQRMGYTRFKVIGQHRVPKQTCPNPSREGNYVPRRFARGSSGMFGEELPGHWLPRNAALALYFVIFLRYRLYGDDGILSRHRVLRLPRKAARVLFGEVGWYDTHARRPE